MGLVCRKIVRNTFCSIPFVLGLTAGVFVYLHNSLGRDNKGGRLRGGHATLSQVSLFIIYNLKTVTGSVSVLVCVYQLKDSANRLTERYGSFFLQCCLL